jgi:tetratricopeptide (TPR) repeat protein
VRKAIYHVTLVLATVGMPPMAIGLSGCAKPPAVDRAMALTRTGHNEEAIALLEERLTHSPDDLPARRMLVRLYGFAGDVNRARAQVDELKKRLPPGDPTADLELGHALELAHRFDEALEAYDQAARVAPNSPVGPREGGLRAARWGEGDVAVERLDEAVRRGARDFETYHALALARFATGDLEGSEDAYRKAIALQPDAPELYLGIASVALKREDHAAALDAYTKLRALRPNLAVAELGRAYSLARLGRGADAKAAIDRAEQLGAPASNIAKLRELVASIPVQR